MRKSTFLMPEIKEKIASLEGRPVKLLVHSGRKKYSKLNGILENVYPCVFTVRINNPVSVELVSYSYSDIVCGDVKVTGA